MVMKQKLNKINMKKLALSIFLASSILAACNNNKANSEMDDSTEVDNLETSEGMTTVKPVIKPGKYINLSSNQEVDIVEDPISHLAIDSKTQIPVQFYYDPITLDTIYQNGLVVNNMLISEGKGKYRLNDMKIKIDGDEIKIKTDSSKMKIDGEDMKMKEENGKMKIDEEEMKVKNESGKMKIDGNEVKIKPSN